MKRLFFVFLTVVLTVSVLCVSAAAKEVESKCDGYSLFNGVKLPSLPEWDKETYPYALVYLDGVDTILLTMPSEFVLEDMGEEHKFQPVYRDYYSYYLADYGWGEPVFVPAHTNKIYFESIIWSNYDLMGTNEDYEEEVYLSASDPIPLTDLVSSDLLPSIFEGLQLSDVLKEIVMLLPVVLVCLVGFIGLRKGIIFLIRFLQKS